MGDMTNRIKWWEWLPLPWRKWRIVLLADAGDEIPDRLPWKGAVLVSPDGRPVWLAFDCPCGRNHRVMLNLHPVRQPYWTVTSHEPLTMSPSVDDKVAGRRCHYFLHAGRIDWLQQNERIYKP